MVALSTQPPSVSGNGGTSVPPPANEIRSGALARMHGRAMDPPPVPSGGRDVVFGVVEPRGHVGGYLLHLVYLLRGEPVPEGAERRARVHRLEGGAREHAGPGPVRLGLAVVRGGPEAVLARA